MKNIPRPFDQTRTETVFVYIKINVFSGDSEIVFCSFIEVTMCIFVSDMTKKLRFDDEA